LSISDSTDHGATSLLEARFQSLDDQSSWKTNARPKINQQFVSTPISARTCGICTACGIVTLPVVILGGVDTGDRDTKVFAGLVVRAHEFAFKGFFERVRLGT
jgi:hypothetical protein